MKKFYTTQMDAARKGILTPQMEQVLENDIDLVPLIFFF